MAKKPKKQYDLIATDQDGVIVMLRVVRGRQPRVDATELSALLDEAEIFEELRSRIERLEADRSISRDAILAIIMRHAGLAGVMSEADDVDLTAVLSERDVVWDRNLLRNALGALFGVIVHDVAKVTVELPPGVMNAKRLRDGIIEQLRLEGVTAKGARELVTVKFESEVVDETALGALIKEGSVTLPEGTRTFTPVWTVTSKPYEPPRTKKPKEKKPAKKK